MYLSALKVYFLTLLDFFWFWSPKKILQTKKKNKIETLFSFKNQEKGHDPGAVCLLTKNQKQKGLTKNEMESWKKREGPKKKTGYEKLIQKWMKIS